MDRLTDFLSETYNAASGALDNLKDNVVAATLEHSAGWVRAGTDTGVALAKGGGVLMAATTTAGALLGDPVAGLGLGAIFTPIVGLPMGMMMGVDDQVDGTSLGHKFESRIWEAHDRYISENEMDRDYINRIGNAKYTPIERTTSFGM